MKIAIILAQPPAREGNAGGRCAVGLIQGLIDHGVEVRAVAARQHWAPDAEEPPGSPVEIVEIPRPRKEFGHRLRKLRRPRSELAHRAFMERVADVARWADVVHLEQSETAWCAEGIDAPHVLHLHYLVGLDRDLGKPWTREFRDTVELMLLERAIVRRFRHLVASSPIVASRLRARAPSSEVTLAPLSLDPHHYPRASLGGGLAGFIGTAVWPPTRSAAEKLIDEIWPRVRAGSPTTTLKIAGRGMAELQDRRSAAHPGVAFEGEVESGGNFISGLDLLLYPLVKGSGMKVKVLEAMACGVPVVTTSQGAEGIAPTKGVVVARSDEEMVSAAISILRDGVERTSRGAAARETFLAHYEPGVATAPLVDLYERVASTGR